MTVFDWLKLRGYSQEDIDSLNVKLSSEEAKRPDGLIEVTPRELRALCAVTRNVAASELEQRAGNLVYRAAWRAAAKVLRQ